MFIFFEPRIHKDTQLKDSLCPRVSVVKISDVSASSQKYYTRRLSLGEPLFVDDAQSIRGNAKGNGDIE